MLMLNKLRLGVVVGTAMAALFQSASATVGILQAVASTGIISMESAVPLIVGISIGAALPVIMAGKEAKATGKSVANFYLFVSLFCAAVLLVLYYSAELIFRFNTGDVILYSVGIALLNTLYRLACIPIGQLFLRISKGS